MPHPLPRLCPGTVRAARRVLLAWFLVVLAGAAAAPLVFSALQGSAPRRDDESGRASALLEAAAPSGERVVGVVLGAADDPVVAAQVTAAATELRSLPGVDRVLDLPSGGPALLRSDDGAAQLVVVDLTRDLTPAATAAAVDAVQARLHAVTGAPVLLGGAPLLVRQASEAAERDLLRAEAVTLPLTFILLLLVFGGATAALLPLLLSLGTVAGALLALAVVARLTDVATYTVNVITMVGFALAVDYGLLVLTRFREERAAGLGVPGAVVRADALAGRTVSISGFTVVAALSALLISGDTTLAALALGGIAATLVAVLAARTLLPALLLLVGHRVRPGAVPSNDGGFARLARAIARRPLPVAAGVTALLLLAALPVAHLSVRHPDHRALPRSAEARQAIELVLQRFPGRLESPVTVVAQAAPGDPRLQRYADDAAARPGLVRASARAGLPAGVAAVDLVTPGEAQGEQAQTLVRDLRASRPPPGAGVKVSVTGDAALLLDHRQRLRDRLPVAALLVVLTTLVLLFGFTGSVVVPVKAVAVAALSLTASLGVLVWGFQDGHLLGLLGAEGTGSLQLELPIVVVVLAFGLSLDYEVFLLGRVKEAHDGGAGPVEAVALGLQRTGRVITSAALLVVVVFAGFASGEVSLVKELGVGLAVAVLVDATLVRCLLVPAVLALLGRRNWWSPAPLARAHRRLEERRLSRSLGRPGAPPARPATPCDGAESTVRQPVR